MSIVIEKIDGFQINTQTFGGGHGGVQTKVFGQYKRALKRQKAKNDVWKRFKERHPSK